MKDYFGNNYGPNLNRQGDGKTAFLYGFARDYAALTGKRVSVVRRGKVIEVIEPAPVTSSAAPVQPTPSPESQS